MRKLQTLIALTLLSSIAFGQGPRIKVGIEVLRERGFDILRGKRIGLITNPTAVDANLVSTIDILHKAPGVKLVALFGPEHGVRGDFAAGEDVESYTDPATGIPVYSLYGSVRKPTGEMLEGIDLLVYDIQDIGIRSYTYISTMGLAMEAAAERGIPFVVLDRPNPLGGLRIEGNVAEREFFSFIGQYPVPYVYGLSCGELARLLTGEGMLTKSVRCKLTVIPMKGWKRMMTFEETGRVWVPTSPHIPHASTVQYCVATGVAGEIDGGFAGIGYTLPFEVFATEGINPYRFAAAMDSLHLEGVLFRPITLRPFYGNHKDSTLSGVQLHITDCAKVNILSLQFHLLEVLSRLYPDKNPFATQSRRRFAGFDKAAGTDWIRKEFSKRMRYADIEGYLNKDVKAFRKLSEKYYLYK